MARLVVHCKKEKYDVYIGRAVPRSGLKASIWGNPFVIGKDGTREEVMVKYRGWLLGNPELLKKLPELKEKVLGCWCAPEACHGDVLSEFASSEPVLHDGLPTSKSRSEQFPSGT